MSEEKNNHLSENIQESVKNELMKNELLNDENIVVDARGDEIILKGDVDSENKKWLAEDIAHNIFGVLQVKNEIEVVEDFGPEATTRTTGERTME